MLRAIYQPKGRAAEYCPWALNLYQGCGHRCLYCYAPAATYKTREKFNQARPRPDILDKLSWDLQALNGSKPDPILLCFTCDPYQAIDAEYKLTRQAIELLKQAGLHVSILSKGGQRAERDLDLLGEGDQFGATLTFLDDKDSLEWEPGAALPGERLAALRKAHSMGIKTWASLEPVIDPEQSLEFIRTASGYIDLFKVGTLNYHPKAKEIDWRSFGHRAVDLLTKLGCAYYIKSDLRKWL